MKGVKRIFENVDKVEFSRYFFFSVLLIITLIVINSLNLTQARYETEAELDLSPNMAFFVVGVETVSGQLKLDGLVPRTQPYLFEFDVSNFNDDDHADVDLTYTIELITTTNIQLNYRIFKGTDMTHNQIDSDTITQDSNGVYYRHLVINDVSTMSYSQDVTDKYTLWVEFPVSNKNYPDEYAGIIELVDVKITAEQVV